MSHDIDNLDNSSASIEPGDLSKLLEEYRERAGLNVDQIAEALCLTPTAIRALESEDFEKLPEPPYVRGYLRSYARLAETDPTHVVNVYNNLRGEPHVGEQVLHATIESERNAIKPPLITPQRFRLSLLTALLLLLALLSMIPGVRNWSGELWSKFSAPADSEMATGNNNPATPQQNLPSLTGDLPGNLPIDPDALTNDAQANEVATEAETVTATTEAAATANTEAEDSVEPEQTAQADAADNEAIPQQTENSDENQETEQNEASNTPPGKNTDLRMVFKEQVWIRIRDGEGKTVFQGLNPADTEKELSLQTPLEFRVGNAPGLQLFVNGEEMDTSEFVKGSVANFGIE